MASATRSGVRGHARLQLIRRPVEEGADVAVFDGAAEEVGPLHHELRAENGPIPGRQHGPDGPGKPHLVAGEGARRRHAQRVAVAEPPDRQRRRVGAGLNRQPAVGRGRRDRFGLESRPARRTGSGPTGAGCRIGRRQRARAAGWPWDRPAIIVHGALPAVRQGRAATAPRLAVARDTLMWHTSWLEHL